MVEIFNTMGPIKSVLLLVLAGSFGTAAMMGMVYILDLPGIRKGVYGFCWLAGKSASLGCIRWFGKKWGQKIEDKLQRFVDEVIYDGFFAGLDQDDK